MGAWAWAQGKKCECICFSFRWPFHYSYQSLKRRARESSLSKRFHLIAFCRQPCKKTYCLRQRSKYRNKRQKQGRSGLQHVKWQRRNGLLRARLQGTSDMPKEKLERNKGRQREGPFEGRPRRVLRRNYMRSKTS